MRKYIFITTPIYYSGGVQCYLAAKAAYLSTQGWDVHVLSPGRKNKECLINSLDKYRNEIIPAIGIPPFFIGKKYVDKVLRRMQKCIGKLNDTKDIIVESHDDISSFWGELLSKKILAKHYFYTMNEYYRGKNKFYEEKIDFFSFKFHRKEIMGLQDTLTRLFDGYMAIGKNDYVGDVIINESPILDIECDKVNLIKQSDWNIAYLGRGEKPYVENIITDIGIFAKNHSDKTINFISISDLTLYKDLLSKILKENSNLSYTGLGYLHPIPKSFFSKIDVMIAGSGSARHSAEEGVLTLVADPEHKQCNGLLGYETMNSIMLDKDSVVSSFSDALNRVLVEKTYLSSTNRYPPKMSVAESTKQNFLLYSKSAKSKEYYDEDKILKGKRNYTFALKTLLSAYVPQGILNLVKFNRRK